MAAARLEVRRLAEEAVRVFDARNILQPEYVLLSARTQGGEMYWLTDLKPAGVLGAGPRVPVSAWPRSTKHFYTWATRMRTCDEMSYFLVAASRELARRGVQLCHEGADVGPPAKVQALTERPIPAPHIMFSGPDGRVHEVYTDDLRSGPLAHVHTFVRFDRALAAGGAAGAAIGSRSLYLDLSYAQFGNCRPFFLGDDRTLGGICGERHDVVPWDALDEVVMSPQCSSVFVMPLDAAVDDLVASLCGPR
jgi:hypothetical protein